MTVVGVVLAVRTKDDIISIWNSASNASEASQPRFNIAQKLKTILNLDMNTIIEYKSFKDSIKDGSSFKNAHAFVISSEAADL